MSPMMKELLIVVSVFGGAAILFAFQKPEKVRCASCRKLMKPKQWMHREVDGSTQKICLDFYSKDKPAKGH